MCLNLEKKAEFFVNLIQSLFGRHKKGRLQSKKLASSVPWGGGWGVAGGGGGRIGA